ncbi:glycoside hydrolase family 113 [Paraconexibacter algicola]|uniref:glycoside hydrolase family 113 n=1 Tax=Paraconexibacter algicola TaxID=2133960 RepID=UPI0013049551|nr:glycoside hydrolase TIM-barrel-like domain-containing protein [Paraconexibacter algicola]
MRPRPAALVAVLLVALGGCGTTTERIDVTVREGPLLGPRWEQGMNLTAYVPDGFSGTRAGDALRALRDTGTTHAVLVPVWYQENAFSADIDPSPLKSPDDAGLLQAARTARSLGLRVVVKPHVDRLDEGFRGELTPVDVDAWFASYTRMVLHYARLADRVRADTFVVGTELVTMARETDRFRTLIAAVRRVYDGELTYAANWVQDAERIGFWDDLDSIGIDAYMPLTADRDRTPTTAELVRAWRPWERRLAALRRRVGGDKPVRFTELGYAARRGATAEPSREDRDAPVDPGIQSIAYTAALRAFRRVPWFVGIWWWDWSLDGRHGDGATGGYTPRGTSAEAVLRRFAGTAARPSAGRSGAGASPGRTTSTSPGAQRSSQATSSASSPSS